MARGSREEGRNAEGGVGYGSKRDSEEEDEDDEFYSVRGEEQEERKTRRFTGKSHRTVRFDTSKTKPEDFKSFASSSEHKS